jgi:hypothetical protein
MESLYKSRVQISGLGFCLVCRIFLRARWKKNIYHPDGGAVISMVQGIAARRGSVTSVEPMRPKIEGTNGPVE